MKIMLRRKKLFTLIELIVAMAAFAFMMAALMQIFTNTQRMWRSFAARTEMSENARIAFGLLSSDLKAMYVTKERANRQFFRAYGYMYAHPTPQPASAIAFLVNRPTYLNKYCNSRVVNVVYRGQRRAPGTTDKTRYSLQIREIGDKTIDNEDDPLWRADTDNPFEASLSSLTENANRVFHVIIQGVVAFECIPLKYELALDGVRKLEAFNSLHEHPEDATLDPGSPGRGEIPDAVEITLVLTDRDTISRWHSNSANGDLTPDIADIKPYSRSFTRTIFIDKGQE